MTRKAMIFVLILLVLLVLCLTSCKQTDLGGQAADILKGVVQDIDSHCYNDCALTESSDICKEKCRISKRTCFDSDSVNKFEKGYVKTCFSEYCSYNYDSCEGDELIEWYCEGDIAYSRNIVCEQGCLDRVCIS